MTKRTGAFTVLEFPRLPPKQFPECEYTIPTIEELAALSKEPTPLQDISPLTISP